MRRTGGKTPGQGCRHHRPTPQTPPGSRRVAQEMRKGWSWEYGIPSLLKLFTDEFPEHKRIASMTFTGNFEISPEELLNNSREIYRNKT